MTPSFSCLITSDYVIQFTCFVVETDHKAFSKHLKVDGSYKVISVLCKI